MPRLGEIRQAREVYKYKDKRAGGNKLVWSACETCGQERWATLVGGKIAHPRCRRCTSKENLHQIRDTHHAWKGGRFYDSDGYVLVRIYPNDFFYPMANKNGYVREHRLVVAQAFGRCLQKWEVVHHRGIKYPQGSKENRGDNRYPENLELGTQHNHMVEHDKGYKDGFRQGYIDGKKEAQLKGA